DSGTISVGSNAAQYSKTFPSVIVLSIEAGKTEERIEAVGEPIDRIQSSIRHERPEGSHSYRFVDPLVVETFDAEIAMAMVRHFCFVVHSRLKPARSLWRWLLYLDRFRVFLAHPGYELVPKKERTRFKKLLKRRRISLIIGED